MIPIPKFKRGLRTSIPVVAIFAEEHTIKEYLVKTAKNYLRLGGDKNISWEADASLDRVALEMNYKLESHVVETIVNRDLIREMVDQYSLGIEIMDFDTEEDIDDGGMFGKRKCRLAVKISLGYWAILSIKFLSNLEKKDKQVYGFMKNLIETLYESPMMPCATQEDCFDMYSFIIDDRAEEDEEYKENKCKAVKKEMALFRRHFRPFKKKISYKKRLKLLEEQYPLIKKKLTKRQKTWVKYAVELIRNSQKLGKIDTFFDLCVLGFDESPTMDSCFNIMWDESPEHAASDFDIAAERAQQLNSYFGETGGPLEVLRLSNQKDLEKAKKFVEHLGYIMQFFYKCQIMNLNGVWDE